MTAASCVRLRSLVVSGAFAISICAATAHTAYLLPSTFAVTKDHIGFQSAMTEDVYFSPEFPVRAKSYDVTDPKGQTNRIDTVTMTKDIAVVDVPTPVDGTYRVSTGSFTARTMKMAKVDGRWVPVRPAGDRRGGGQARFIEESALPAGAEIVEAQNILKSEAYVTKGAPTSSALQTVGSGLELKPLTHPNEIYLDKGFDFQILLDGKPQTDFRVAVYRGGNSYEDKKVYAEAQTDADGRISLKFDKPGIYLLSGNHPRRRAQGGEPVPRSYTYSLTFEVLQ